MRFMIFCDCCSHWCVPAMRYLDFVLCDKCKPHFLFYGKPGKFKNRKHFKDWLIQVRIDLRTTNKTLN